MIEKQYKIKLAHIDETEKSAHDSQIIRAKENLKLSHGGSSYSQASGTNPPIKPRKNFGFSGEEYNCMHFKRRNAFQNA